MREKPDLTTIPDDELLHRLSELLKQSRRTEADLIAHIAEVDARKLYAREAAPSMFAYCTEVLHLSEHEAYLRITTARASREHPMLLTMLRDGRLHLSGVALLARHLTRENRDEVLQRAVRLPHRRIKELAAELAPRADVPATVRKLPDRRTAASRRAPGGSQLVTYRVESPTLTSHPGVPASGGAEPQQAPSLPKAAAARPTVVEPLSPGRHKVQFTATTELREKLERLQALMRSSVPDGDLGRIIDLAVTEKLERLEAKRFAKTKAPRKALAEADTAPKSRYIPAPVRRVVEKRDGGRCTYRDRKGRRCSKRHDLEFHHQGPFGRGGKHRPENISLLCRTHNLLMAERDYGREKMARHRRSARKVSGPLAVPAFLAPASTKGPRGPSPGG